MANQLLVTSITYNFEMSKGKDKLLLKSTFKLIKSLGSNIDLESIILWRKKKRHSMRSDICYYNRLLHRIWVASPPLPTFLLSQITLLKWTYVQNTNNFRKNSKRSVDTWPLLPVFRRWLWRSFVAPSWNVFGKAPNSIVNSGVLSSKREISTDCAA